MKYFFLIIISLFKTSHALALEIIPLVAQYTVPASETTSEATFLAPEYWIADDGANNTTMNIVMPMELVGHASILTLQMKAKVGEKKFFGSEVGQAQCSGPWTQMNCAITFKNIQIDKVMRDAFIDAQFSGEENKNMKAISSRFSTDPIGQVQVLGRK